MTYPTPGAPPSPGQRPPPNPPGGRRTPAGPGSAGPGPAGPYRPVARSEIAAAIPEGSRRARTQHEVLRRLGEDPDLALLRCDRARNVAEAARVIARRASWLTRLSRPVIACGACRRGGDCRGLGPRRAWCLIRAAAISLSTWKAARRWLELHGYLGTVRGGWTPLLRASALIDEQAPNEAALYVLCVPRRRPKDQPPVVHAPVTRPLTPSRSEGGNYPARDPGKDLPHEAAKGSPAWIVAYLRRQVAELRRGPGSTLSDRGVLALARPFLAARWSPADLAKAISHDPVRGVHLCRIAGVREPGAWLAWRLSRWTTDPSGVWAAFRRLGHWNYQDWPVPLASPGQRELARAAAEAEQRRQVLAPACAPAADPHAWAEKIRAGWKSRPRPERK